MKQTQLIISIKQDLDTMKSRDVDLMARQFLSKHHYVNCASKCDLEWMLAVELYHKFKLSNMPGKRKRSVMGGDKQRETAIKKWKTQQDIFVFIQQLIQNPPDLSIFPYIVDPKSVRGHDLIEILNEIAQYAKDDADKDLRRLYTNWHGIDDDRVNLLILTLQMLLFCESIEDMNSHLDLGHGTNDPYTGNGPGKNVNIILAKYPNTKPLCVFGRKCPYWECNKSITEFTVPYAIMVNGITNQPISDSDIISINNIKLSGNEKDAREKAISHHHMWGHLVPLPAQKIIFDYDFSNVPIDDDTGAPNYYSQEAANAPLKRKCNDQQSRTAWGRMQNDRRWRANYAYITELCLEKGGMYYWD